MQNEMLECSREVDMGSWKETPLEYGRYQLAVRVPPECEVISMKPIPVVAAPAAAYREALSRPIGSPTLGELIRA